jgi:hypothetical protein
VKTFEPTSNPLTIGVSYPAGRPRHPLTPPALREWYETRFTVPKCIAWHAESKTGFKAGLDEGCWRDEDIADFHLEWARPAKGPGFVAWFQEVAVWLQIQGHRVVTFDCGDDA